MRLVTSNVASFDGRIGTSRSTPSWLDTRWKPLDRFEQAPAPAAGPGEALIAVHAAAITFAELTWDLEWTTRDGKDRTPVTPSHEMSGTVAGLGDGVAGLAAGDEVIGLVDFDRDGAAAEYVVMPAASLAAKPPSVSHVQAAARPCRRTRMRIPRGGAARSRRL